MSRLETPTRPATTAELSAPIETAHMRPARVPADLAAMSSGSVRATLHAAYLGAAQYPDAFVVMMADDVDRGREGAAKRLLAELDFCERTGRLSPNRNRVVRAMVEGRL